MDQNRYWNGQQEAPMPLATYSPMSMQEMAYAPQIMHQREQELTGQLDAMNESNSTLKAMLGDKGATTDKFNDQYQQTLNSIAKEGATPQAIDKARNLRKIFMQEVKPQENFAVQRQQMYQQYLKDKSDPSKIVIGRNPLDIGYDEWSKSKAFEPHQSVDRDRLIAHGAKIGSEWATGNTKAEPNEYDMLEVTKGFKNADEAMASYQSDPKFKSWVDSQTQLAASAAGTDPSNPDVANAIRSGIMTSVVGGTQLHNLPPGYIKDKNKPESNKLTGNFLKMEDVPLGIVPSDDMLDLASKHPGMLNELNKATMQLTDGKYDYTKMQEKLKTLSRPYTPEEIQNQAASSGSAASGMIHSSVVNDPEGLYNKQAQLKEMIKENPFFNTLQRISFDDDEIGKLGESNAKDVYWRAHNSTHNLAENAVRNGELVANAYDDNSKDILTKIQKQESSVDDVKVVGIAAQGMSAYDPSSKIRQVDGTGKPIMTLRVTLDSGGKGKVTKDINVLPTDRLLEASINSMKVLYNHEGSSENDKQAISNIEYLLSNYYKSKRNK